MNDMLEFLRSEGIDESTLAHIEAFRRKYPVNAGQEYRVPRPKYMYYGLEVWRRALAAFLLPCRTAFRYHSSACLSSCSMP